MELEPDEHTIDVMADAIRTLLVGIGEDPDREGLADTPKRYAKALCELTSWTDVETTGILKTSFAGEGYDQVVVVSGIPFNSLCEHHMLPFSGHVTVGYLPSERVVGLSKIPRLVNAYSHRLQIQERLTEQIADTIHTELDARGVGVIVTAHHTCMSMRGVKSHGNMTTSAMRGAMLDNAETRAELLALHREA